ncbi:unnamed protein product [Strongylus vulgaris]|uniref:Major facilitator superfamily (MFS) profile domain-containing protein n=1 Tax=Strongylus vulgaris TaxID=40348 RepID=A0A3P7J5V9_STRVU|nr:unnamed protein product [Strongylus vulgaris]
MSKQSDRLRLICICCTLSFSVNFQYAFSSTYTNAAVHSFQRFLNESYTTNNVKKDIEQGTDLISKCFLVYLEIAIIFLVELVAFLLGNALNVIGSLARCLAIAMYSPIILIIARILCGFATAISYSALVLYLQEVAPPTMRGMTSCLNGLIYSFIAFLGVTLGNDLLLGKNLLYYFGVAVPPCILGAAALVVFPETPKFLLSRKKYNLVQISLQFYHGRSSDVSASLSSIEQDVNEASHGDANYSDLFVICHLRAALLLALAALQVI